MDLFYGSTFEENVKAFKRDLKTLAELYGIEIGRRPVIAYGNQEHVGNCMLVVGPPLDPKQKPFQDKYSQYLFQTTNEFNLTNVVLTSSYLLPKEQVSKLDIKGFGSWVEKIVDIFQPKLIVVLGEDSQFSFVKRKFILRDHHGQIIAKSVHDIDVLLTYEMSYYLEKSEFEDPSYKNYIRKADWSIIAKLYNERIK